MRMKIGTNSEPTLLLAVNGLMQFIPIGVEAEYL